MSLDTVLQSIFTAAFVATVIRVATPLLLPALGGLISELAGVINIALEGIMLMAAFVGVVVSAFAPGWLPGAPIWVYPWLGALAGVLAGVAMAWLVAFFHLELGADIILAALGINILAQGGTIFLLFNLTSDKGSSSSLASFALPEVTLPLVDRVPVLGTLLSGYNILTYAAFLFVLLVWLFLYRTPYGTHLRAVGESPEAAASVGINVKRVQYSALLLSGALAALGGINLSMGYLTIFQNNMTAGRGFIALAIIYLGNLTPLGTLVAALLFGAATALGTQLGTLSIPSQYLDLIPPVATILALVIYNLRRRAQLVAHSRQFEQQVATPAPAAD